jgi:hypothetical protein
LGSLVASTNLSVALPPWLSFSGRWPWVSTGVSASTRVANGSLPFSAGVASVIHTIEMPIDSYHEARLVS